jgi:hypothetical protein
MQTSRQADYEDLRNQIEPLSTAVQRLQGEKDALQHSLQLVRSGDWSSA